MDDGYAIGPPEAVFPAVLRFAEAIRPLGLELQLAKCKCYSPAGGMEEHPTRPRQMQGLHSSFSDARESPAQCGIPVQLQVVLPEHCELDHSTETVSSQPGSDASPYLPAHQMDQALIAALLEAQQGHLS